MIAANSHLLSTRVLLNKTSKLAGLIDAPEETEWCDCVINLKRVIAVRRTASEDEETRDKAVVYFGNVENNYFIIDYSYSYIKDVWVQVNIS